MYAEMPEWSRDVFTEIELSSDIELFDLAPCQGEQYDVNESPANHDYCWSRVGNLSGYQISRRRDFGPVLVTANENDIQGVAPKGGQTY